MSNWIIPGNVKQQYVPFVLDPNNKLHGDDDTAGTPQHFTFKDKDGKSTDKTKYGVLNIVPSSYKTYMGDDISNKLLYGREGQKSGAQITYQEIFNSLPVIQIREFLPDSKLDQCINFFGDLIKSFKNMWKEPKKAEETQTATNTNNGTQTTNTQKKDNDSPFSIKRLLCTIWYAVEYILGIGDHGTLVGDMFTDSNGSAKYQHIYTEAADKANRNVKITDFPYAFYYRMQSCTTTNIYEIPGIIQSKMLYSSAGSVGWEGSGDWDRGFNVGAKQKSALMKMLTSNIGVAWAPWWDPIKGVGTKEEEVKIDFNLFNDTNEAAMQNFIFVNTLIPNNRWIQYGLFQHSGAVYDVKLEGYGRLFFCTGDFQVTMEGVLRDPPESWLKELCDSHSNPRVDKSKMLKVLKDAKAIKIPDVYKVSMTFQSQLPQNFNTWLFNYSHNFDNFVEYGENQHYDPSFIATALPNTIKKLGTNVANYYKNWSESASKDLAISKLLPGSE